MTERLPDGPDHEGAVYRSYRFATIPEWVLYHPTLTATAKLIYGCLDRHGQEPESCYPSHATIAARLSISERSVAKPLRELADAGAVQVMPRYIDGRQTSNGYRLAGDQPLGTALGSAPAHAQERGTGRAEERGGTHAQERDKREPVEREPEERENTLALVGERPVRSSNFEAFYAAYPKHVEPKAARRAWDKAVKAGVSPVAILEGAVRYAAETAGSRFVKNPATWLNAGCWDDEPGANRRGEASAAGGARGAIDTDRGGISGVVPKEML